MAAAAEDPVANPKPALVLVPGKPARQAAPTADDEAIIAVWHAHGAALKQFALKLTLGDEQRAEDIVQETLVRAWRHPEVVGDGRNAIRSWLFTVIRRIAIDMWRARSRGEELNYGPRAEQPDPIEQAVTGVDVRAALAMLSTEQRQVIVELYYYDRSCRETAEILGIPAGTVKSRAYYGLRKMRRALSPEPILPASDTTSPRSASA